MGLFFGPDSGQNFSRPPGLAVGTVFKREPTSTTHAVNFALDLLVTSLVWLVGLAAGLVFSLCVGGWAVNHFYERLRTYMRLPVVEDPATRRVPERVTGAVERAFFTLLVAFFGPAASAVMIAWLAVKMAANWNRPDVGITQTTPSSRLPGVQRAAQRLMELQRVRRARGAVRAAVVGLLSMGFALVGGMISRAIVFAGDQISTSALVPPC